nr:5768_t:CDS:2 [Entrophospora candida]
MSFSTFSRRGYKKPSTPREFAKSAKKRNSVLSLGSITHLQHFYAKRNIIIKPKLPKNIEEARIKKFSIDANINMPDLLQVTEEFDDDFPPTPIPPIPQPTLPYFLMNKLDVEVDPDVLLANCHANIQGIVDVWRINNTDDYDKLNENIDTSKAIESTSILIKSVKDYSMIKQDISNESLSMLRVATLEVLEMIDDLETSLKNNNNNNNRSLARQQEIIQRYIQTVEDYLLFDKDIHLNTASYLKRFSLTDTRRDSGISLSTPPLTPTYRIDDSWLDSENFGDDKLARYHAFLEAFVPSKLKQSPNYKPIPDPRIDKSEFLKSLSDGRLLCNIYNTIVKYSKQPFGFIDKIHEDTSRTYRVVENLNFFATAVKLRFDVKFEEFDVKEIKNLTEIGEIHLEKALELFCEKAMNESISTGSHHNRTNLSGSSSSSPIRQETNDSKLSKENQDLATEITQEIQPEPFLNTSLCAD